MMEEKKRLILKYKLIWLGIFAITMGYFEATLVEYLRELYYPEGFAFPLKDVPMRIGIIEIGREAMSLIMILAVSAMVGRLFIDRFAAYCFCFGVWDITYYLFLYLFEGWPPSLATTDILFLIPAPWVGPVWAPVAVSIALIWAAVNIWDDLDKGWILKPTRIEWTLEIISGLIIISSFLVGAPAAINKTSLPNFPWVLWLAGMILGIVIFLRSQRRAHLIENQG